MMKVYITGSYPDIKVRSDLLDRLKKDKQVAKKIANGELELIDIGASLQYTEEQNKELFSADKNAKNLSEKISGTNDVGIIFCKSGVGALNYSVVFPYNIVGKPDSAKEAKFIREKCGVSILAFSSEYSKFLFSKVRAFILAQPDFNDEDLTTTKQRITKRKAELFREINK